MPVAYGFLSTFPPTQCGLATFTASMLRSLTRPETGDRGGVVRVVERPTRSTSPEVVAHLDRTAGALERAAEALNAFDVAIVQHEYGIYGGEDGDDVLDGARGRAGTDHRRRAHRADHAPRPHQREVLEQVVALADAVVTMTVAARDRLVPGYRVDATKIIVIPHGADARRAARPSRRTAEPHLLTWGLLGPGKGIEWAVDGRSPGCGDLDPVPTYMVAGQTHPRVLEHAG